MEVKRSPFFRRGNWEAEELLPIGLKNAEVAEASPTRFGSESRLAGRP